MRGLEKEPVTGKRKGGEQEKEKKEQERGKEQERDLLALL